MIVTPQPHIQKYDAFILSLTWTDGFCKTNACPSAVGRGEFKIHGLWPTFRAGGDVRECNPSIGFPSKIDDWPKLTTSQLAEHWPSLSTTSNIAFWGDEWRKHGTCMDTKNGPNSKVQNPEYYCSATLNMFFRYTGHKLANLMGQKKVTPGKTYQANLLFSALVSITGSKHIELQCSEKNNIHYLTEVRIYVDENGKPISKSVRLNKCKSPLIFF
ncbi:hypothetical protein RIF29_24980 [Crotalaria pallida]|uniref:Uncharacterized protein n=1 Tax=Crotalaria pallida TaxID=3830 RepID=A0AAN9HX29_CROPI